MTTHRELVMVADSVPGNPGREEETHPFCTLTFLNKLMYEKYLARRLAHGKCHSINVILLLLLSIT